jgi:hypothetical protein
MNRIALVVVSALSLSGCFNNVEGGPEVSKTRSLERFSRLRVESGLPVKFSPGAARVSITAPQKVEENLQTVVSNDTLVVRMKPGVFVDSFESTEVVVSGEGVANFNAVAGSSLSATGLSASQYVVEASGGSAVSLEGTSVDLHLEASGGSHLAAAKLGADFVSLDASGGSTLEVRATKAVGGTASSGSTVLVSGPGDFSTVYATGGSSVGAAAN